jgi:hypothetical protein
MGIHDRIGAAHKRAALVFGEDEIKWSLKGVIFSGTLGPGKNDQAVEGAPRNLARGQVDSWLSAQKSLWEDPDSIKKGNTITDTGSGKKYRIEEVSNLPNDPLLNFKIHI